MSEQLVSNSIGRQYWIYSGDSFYQQRIANAGPYQKHNLLRLRQLVPNARTVIDAGMNIGMNTIEYATWAQNVHGFEPTKQTYDMAEKNIELAKRQTDADFKKGWFPDKTQISGWASPVITGNIHTYNCALGEKRDTVDILIKKNNAGHNHVDNIHIPTSNGKSRVRKVEPEKEQVDVYTLDSYNFTDVDIIKVDTEGFEFAVVKGAENTIMKHLPVVQLEMVESHAKKFGYSCQDVYDWFTARDFVSTLSTGTVDGSTWYYVPKKMERFFIHKSKMATQLPL